MSGWCLVSVWLVCCSRLPAAPATDPHLTARADRVTSKRGCSRPLPAAPATDPHLTARADRVCHEQARPLPAAPAARPRLTTQAEERARLLPAAVGCTRHPPSLD
eukprot:6867049-Pyramimonas_sp.AAC.1